MKQTLTLLAALVFGVAPAVAQPEISYLLPDLGTPNMNTYVEVYAPHNAPDGMFGADGISLNNPGDAVRLELVNPGDSVKVIIGPLVISWRGKLLTTQIFVRPTLPVPPNSDDWEQLAPAFRIPVRVRVNGATSNVDTFYVVNPFRFGDKSGSPERTLGAGSLGKRSRRGAMLVDSMILAPSTYSVNLNDCDAVTTGNQGFLPFIVIAQGKVESAGGAKIQVDGNFRNGGPGGGGGAGRTCDANLLGGGADGSDGGNGYTGGGRGGRNNGGKPGSNVRKSPGRGTGRIASSVDVGGFSLNGVPGGEAQSNTFECAGGGTGHPFGQSGTGWNGANQNTITGAFGGGTGQSQSEQGGGGGYGTDGDSPTRNNGGKMHGNSAVVPLAGGSGGASGNPQALGGGCGGEGGGGGGAIRIAAKLILNLDVSAQGGLGEDGNSPPGGSGSGGHIGLQAKLGVGAWSADVRGGGYSSPANRSPRGGHGRLRYDSPTLAPDTSRSYDGTIYRGPSTDTQSVVKRVFTLRGSGNGQPAIIFIKPEFGPWTIVDSTIPGYQNTWFLPIDLNDPRIFRDSRYYIVGAQRIQNPDSRNFLMEPGLVMSQAAANIVIIADQPIIASARGGICPRVVCPGAASFDTLRVKNDGAADLVISQATWQSGNQGFSVAAPAFPMTIKPQTTGNIIIRFQPPAGSTAMIFSDSLILANNDPEKGKSPWTVGYLASRDTLTTEFLNRAKTQTIDTVDFGKLCLGDASFTAASLKNRSSKALVASGFTLTDKVHFSGGFSSATTIGMGGELDLTVGFLSRSRGKMTARFVVNFDECDLADTLVLIGEGIETQLEFTGVGQFARVRVGDVKTVEVELRNTGNAPAELENFPPTLSAPFRVISVQPPSQTVPPGGVVKILVEYAPTAENYDSAYLELRSMTLANMCPDTARLLFAGQGIRSDLRASAPSFIFGAIAQCDVKDDSVTLKNFGTADVTLTERAIITGQNFGAFSILSQPAAPFLLRPGDSAKFVVRFTASLGVPGLNTAILTIPTDDPAQPRVDLPLSGRQEPLQLQIPQTVISGGIVPVPQSANINFAVQNTGALPAVITAVLASRSAVTPQTAVLNQNDFVSFTATIAANQAGIIRDTVRIVFSQPCPDTQNVVIEITAVEAALAFSNSLDFGKIPSCLNVSDSVSFANSGQASLQLLDMQITGRNAAEFSFASPAVFSIALAPGQTFSRAIRFDPGNSTDGVKTAEVLTNAMINGVRREFRTQLRGERETALLAAPGNVVFGLVEMLTTAQQRLTITNISSQTILLDRVRWASGGLPFAFALDPLRQPPLSVSAGETITLTISFTPTAEGTFIDTLLLLQSQPCDDIRKIVITGIGIPTLRSALYLPVDEQVDPTASDYVIPITLRMTPATATLSNASFIAEFTIDERLFVPVSVSKGTMNWTVNPVTRQRTIRVTGDNFSTSTPETTIAEIRGAALLGSVEQDSLRWVQFNWTAGTAARVDSLIDGHLKLVLCEKGGKRLLNDDAVRAFGLAAAPNPASDDLTIAAYTVEVGGHAVELLNAQGRSVFAEHWNVAPAQAGSVREIVIPAGELAAGIYTVILRTPVRTAVLRAAVAK